MAEIVEPRNARYCTEVIIGTTSVLIMAPGAAVMDVNAGSAPIRIIFTCTRTPSQPPQR